MMQSLTQVHVAHELLQLNAAMDMSSMNSTVIFAALVLHCFAYEYIAAYLHANLLVQQASEQKHLQKEVHQGLAHELQQPRRYPARSHSKHINITALELYTRFI